MGVESNKGHREVRVVSNFTDLVNQFNLFGQTVEIRELKLRYSEEVCCFFHRCLKSFKLSPEVVELAAICHKVHFNVEIGKKVIKLLREVLQILGLSLKLHLALLQSSFLPTLDPDILLLKVLAAPLNFLLNQLKERLDLLKHQRFVTRHLVLVDYCFIDFVHVPVKNHVNLAFHALALLLQRAVLLLILEAGLFFSAVYSLDLLLL